jgi:ferredoxin
VIVIIFALLADFSLPRLERSRSHATVMSITVSLRPRFYTEKRVQPNTKTLIPEIFLMAYVITDSCIKDSLCVDVCPTDCVHPKQDEPGFEEATQLFVDPVECIECGACVPACTSDSILAVDDVPDDKKPFIARNAAFFKN